MNKYLIATHRALSLTFIRYQKLKVFFESDFEKAWKASIKDLQAADLDTRSIEKFLTNRPKVDPDKELAKLEQCGAQILVYGMPQYPKSLENIYNPPVLLFARGELKETDFPAIAVVGSRKVSPYGRRAAELVVGELARSGITIVSGFAYGIDTLAHKIAVENGARTIAVMGCGIDQIYPQSNQSFGLDLIHNNTGVILSEYLPGTEPIPENFPVRNRIVAGISRAILVVEAAKKSGSLITAELGVEMGRDVFAVPGEIFSKNAEGTNNLIVKGMASPTISGAQMLEELGLQQIAAHKEAKKNIPTTGTEQALLDLFEKADQMDLNEIIRQANVPNSVVISTVAILEIKGLVKHLGRQIYTTL
jgi:DNA processing protein